MNVGIVYHGTYPWNRGVDQLAQTLKHLGCSPQIVARANHWSKTVDSVRDIPLVHMPPYGRKDRWNILLAYHLPFNLLWRKWLIELGRNGGWKAIVVRETPLAWPVLSAARKLRIPAYLDMRENISAMYKAGRAKNVFLRPFRHPLVVTSYEKATVPKFSHIFAVSEELRKWVVQSYDLDEKKVSILENTPHEDFLVSSERALAQRVQSDGFLRLVYAGTVEERKGIGDIIWSIPYILPKCSKVQLRIIGEGSALDSMKALVVQLGLSSVVEFMPMLSIEALAFSLAECDIGIESCWITELTQLTVPGKLFEYMATGLPILSSARRPVLRIVNEVGCGKAYYSRDPEEIAKCVLSLIANRKSLEEMGQNGRKAILQRYNWKSNIATLRSVL
jgi:glycosyltransferase involved in cell wall biosynthesis